MATKKKKPVKKTVPAKLKPAGKSRPVKLKAAKRAYNGGVIRATRHVDRDKLPAPPAEITTRTLVISVIDSERLDRIASAYSLFARGDGLRLSVKRQTEALCRDTNYRASLDASPMKFCCRLPRETMILLQRIVREGGAGNISEAARMAIRREAAGLPTGSLSAW